MRSATSSHIRVIFPFAGGNIGGSHVSTMTLASRLSTAAGTSCVFLIPTGTSLHYELAAHGLQVAGSGEAPEETLSVPPIWQEFTSFTHRRFLLSSLIRRDCKAIVHCNDLVALRSWALPARSLSLPVIYHHRSLNQMSYKKRALISLANHVICISRTTYDNVNFGSSWKRTLIWNPFVRDVADGETTRATLIKELGLAPQHSIVGFVGNFSERKRPFYFVDVARAMLEHRRGIHFVMYGGSREFFPDDVKRYAGSMGLERNLSILGFRTPPQYNIASLDLLLATSVREPFGRTLVEAAFQKVPYVATEDAGHKEIVNTWGGGGLVPKNAPAELYAQVALSVLEAPEKFVLDTSRHSKIVDDLCVDRHVSDIMAVYRQT